MAWALRPARSAADRTAKKHDHRPAVRAERPAARRPGARCASSASCRDTAATNRCNASRYSRQWPATNAGPGSTTARQYSTRQPANARRPKTARRRQRCLAPARPQTEPHGRACGSRNLAPVWPRTAKPALRQCRTPRTPCPARRAGQCRCASNHCRLASSRRRDRRGGR